MSIGFDPYVHINLQLCLVIISSDQWASSYILPPPKTLARAMGPILNYVYLIYIRFGDGDRLL